MQSNFQNFPDLANVILISTKMSQERKEYLTVSNLSNEMWFIIRLNHERLVAGILIFPSKFYHVSEIAISHTTTEERLLTL
jgi:hypothetical protein